MKWRRHGARLLVSNAELDFPTLRREIDRGVISADIAEIIYETPAVTCILRGAYLRDWLSARTVGEFLTSPSVRRLMGVGKGA